MLSFDSTLHWLSSWFRKEGFFQVSVLFLLFSGMCWCHRDIPSCFDGWGLRVGNVFFSCILLFRLLPDFLLGTFLPCKVAKHIHIHTCPKTINTPLQKSISKHMSRTIRKETESTVRFVEVFLKSWRQQRIWVRTAGRLRWGVIVRVL